MQKQLLTISYEIHWEVQMLAAATCDIVEYLFILGETWWTDALVITWHFLRGWHLSNVLIQKRVEQDAESLGVHRFD